MFRSKLANDPNLKTDVYVWGNGVSKDTVMDYSNFYPKKITNFSTDEDPTIISVKFGPYNEAYLDNEGRVYCCDKYKLPSKKIID